MSDKPQSPKSDKLNRTTYTVQYEIDGVRYFEERSLDVANGNFLAPLGIKKVNPDAGIFSKDFYVSVDPESEEGKTVLNSMVRRNKLVDFAKDWAYNDDETFNAAVESGYIRYANEQSGYSFINEKGVPNVDANNERIKKEEIDAENARLEEFKKSIEVKNEHYRYPIDMKSDEGQDYIFFEQFEYLPPQNVPRSGDKETLKNDIGKTLKQGVARGRNTKVRHGSCKLPIPNKLGVSNGVNWGEGRANAVELSAFQSADRGIQELITKGNVLKAIRGAKNQAGQALNVVQGDLQNRESRTAENISAGDVLSATLARSVLGTIGINVDIDQFITRQTGAAINPNLELLFGGPQLRSFSFNFNFAPNSTEEAKEVRQIQRWFRQGMLPSRRRASQTSGSALFLASPNVFRICYKNQNRRIKGLNIIKICALTSCQIDFTPDGTYQSYDDVDGVSMPVRSTMGITFTELTPVFKDDYSEKVESPSMLDLDTNVTGVNAIDENDIGI